MFRSWYSVISVAAVMLAALRVEPLSGSFRADIRAAKGIPRAARARLNRPGASAGYGSGD